VQVVPQAPQSKALLLKSTHAASQVVLPTGQPHFPAEHPWPAPHFVSHAPQLDAVVWRSTHASPQRVSPFGHACELGMQIVTAQISPVAQARSQLPQWRGEFKLEHSAPHSCSPAAHAHLPSTHAAPPPQAVSHAPQWAASDIGSKHWPWQNSALSGQPQTPP